jgi:hypothetical protein
MAKFDHHAVYKQYLAEAPSRGEKTAWTRRKAEELGVSPSAINYAIASERERDFFDSAEAKVTAAQIIASEMGASASKATRKMMQLLNAKRCVKVHDRDGKLIQSYDEPDLRVQLAAAEKLLKLHGAMSDKVEVVVNQDRAENEEELDARIAELEKKLNGGQ